MIMVLYNFYYDNGIKLFGFDGKKFDDVMEFEIEVCMDCGLLENFVEFVDLGCVKRIDDV